MADEYEVPDTGSAEKGSAWENFKSKITEIFNNVRESIKNAFHSIGEVAGQFADRLTFGQKGMQEVLHEELLKARKEDEKQEALSKQADKDLDEILKGMNEKNEPDASKEPRKSMKELLEEVQNANKDIKDKIEAAEQKLEAVKQSVYSSDINRVKDILSLEKTVDRLKDEMGKLTQEDLDKMPDDAVQLAAELDKVYKDVHEESDKIGPEDRDKAKDKEMTIE